MKSKRSDGLLPPPPKAKPIEESPNLMALYASDEYKAMKRDDRRKAQIEAFHLDNPELADYGRRALNKKFELEIGFKSNQMDIVLQKDMVRDLLMNCIPYNTIVNWLMQNCGLTRPAAQLRISTTTKEFMLSKDYEDWKNINIMRLDNILQKTFEAGKYGDCIKAIDTQNKMVGAYAPTQLEVTQCNAIF